LSTKGERGKEDPCRKKGRSQRGDGALLKKSEKKDGIKDLPPKRDVLETTRKKRQPIGRDRIVALTRVSPIRRGSTVFAIGEGQEEGAKGCESYRRKKGTHLPERHGEDRPRIAVRVYRYPRERERDMAVDTKYGKERRSCRRPEEERGGG